jgi:hypothetical protein
MKAAMLQVITPENKTLLSLEKAINQFYDGKKILVELHEGDCCYAAHVFASIYGDTMADLTRNQEYVQNGTWYVLQD